MFYRSAKIQDFPPFLNQTIEFPALEKDTGLAEVHIFTGPNGTGKSRLLEMLAAASVAGHIAQVSSRRFQSAIGLGKGQQVHSSGSFLIQRTCKLLPKGGIEVLIEKKPSPPSFAFTGAAYLSSDPIAVAATVPVLGFEHRISFGKRPDQSKNVCQGIANLKIQAAMERLNAYEGDPLQGSSRWFSITSRLEQAVSEATGRRFAAIVTSHPKPEIKFRWGKDTLLPDQLPDGLRSLLGWIFEAAIQMEMMLPEAPDPLVEPCLFFLDEIEMHLHPAWQRRVLPLVQRVFPKAQIFIASHSPFLVSSLNNGWIHRLKPDKDGHVTVLPPLPASAGDSYVSATAAIFGVDEWFDPESEAELDRFRALRDAALDGDEVSLLQARDLAGKIAERGPEIQMVVAAELRQMEKQLSQPVR